MISPARWALLLLTLSLGVSAESFAHDPLGVAAANGNTIWNERGAGLTLALQFVQETTLFYSLVAVGLALALVVGWKLSVLRFEARERQLAKLVEEKTEELRKANNELMLLANSDSLTAVGNRRQFEEFLSAEWRRAIRFKTEVSLILLDIDHFKLFNDTYGHHAGDECLRAVAAALTGIIHRPTDLLTRFGGEEFAIVLGGTDAAGAMNIAEQAMAKVDALKIPHSSSPTSAHLTISIGLAAMFVTVGMSESELIKAADGALYRAKAGGRHRIAS